jgi:hypothetical protein
LLELAPAELAFADLEGQKRAQEPIDEPRLRRRLRDDPEAPEPGYHLGSVVNGWEGRLSDPVVYLGPTHCVEAGE